MDTPARDDYAYELFITLPLDLTPDKAEELAARIDDALQPTLDKLDAQIVESTLYTY